MLNKGVYTDKELDSLIGTELKSQMLDSCDDVLRTNKLKKIMKMVISLNKLDNSDNLEDGRPSNTLFTYYVTSLEYYIFKFREDKAITYFAKFVNAFVKPRNLNFSQNKLYIWDLQITRFKMMYNMFVF